MYASVNWVNIGSGNGLVPVRRQAITLTNACLSSMCWYICKQKNMGFVVLRRQFDWNLHIMILNV